VIESDESIEIVSGLKEGDKVLIVSRRYTPQKEGASSPLVMGRSRGQNTQGGRRSQ
jgi:hypothetical protein